VFSYDGLSVRKGSTYKAETLQQQTGVFSQGFTKKIPIGKENGEMQYDITPLFDKTAICIFSYLKALNLFFILTELRKDTFAGDLPLNIEDLGGENICMVADEFLAMSSNLNPVMQAFESVKAEFKGLNKKQQEERKEEYDDVLTFIDLFEKFYKDLHEAYTNWSAQSAGKGHVTLMVLTQTVPGTEADLVKDGKGYSLQKQILGNDQNMVKLIGRSMTSKIQGTNKVVKDKPEWEPLLESYRYFAISEKRNMDGSNTKVFKSYLTLNSAEEDAECVKEMANIPGIEKVLRDENGNIIPEVGIEGYVKMVGGNITETLKKSWTVMEYLINDLLGYNGTVDDFMYSVDIKTFRAYSSLVELAKDRARGDLSRGLSKSNADSDTDQGDIYADLDSDEEKDIYADLDGDPDDFDGGNAFEDDLDDFDDTDDFDGDSDDGPLMSDEEKMDVVDDIIDAVNNEGNSQEQSSYEQKKQQLKKELIELSMYAYDSGKIKCKMSKSAYGKMIVALVNKFVDSKF
jgi:hypothetical protein